MNENLAVRATRGMPGIGMLGSVCGTVSGATMVIGLRTTSKDNIRDRQASHKTYEMVRKFFARFEDRHSSINCRDLLGRDISSWEKSQAAAKDKAFANCPRFVESAVNILEELFDSENSPVEEASQD
jgi:C_GCAxxG_C_C family probable redox protein